MVRIIGTTHLHQPVAPGFLVPPDIECEQKQRFRSVIDSFLASTEGWFVGEEFTHGLETFASLHASRHIYLNIEMPHELRMAQGIPPAYADEGSPFSPEQIAEKHRVRERYMFDQAVSHCRETSESLIICGLEHLAALHSLFAGEFKKVKIIDLRREKWFLTDWRCEAIDRDKFKGF